MSTHSFEFSAADAVTTKKVTQEKTNSDLDCSLEEISKRERSKRIEEKKKAIAAKKEQKKASEKPKDRKRSNDKTVSEKKGKKEKHEKKEFKINVPEHILKDILKEAGVDSNKFKVSLYAIPRRHD